MSSTEIRVGISGVSTESSFRSVAALFEFVNQRFELYGRRLVPVHVLGSALTAVDARARAADLAAQNVFASLTGPQEWNTAAQAALPTELARAGIVTVVHGGTTWWTDRTLYDPSHPYVWSVHPSAEELLGNLGDFGCTSLAQHEATFAGDVALRSTMRKFGVVAAGTQTPPPTRVLVDLLEACSGAEVSQVEWSQAAGSAALQTGMARLRADGVTTAVCVCERTLASDVASRAGAAGFQPEWVVTSSGFNGVNDEQWVQSARRSSPPIAPPIRVSAGPRAQPWQARPWFGAIQGLLGAPGLSASTISSIAELVYPEVLLLASGVQAAGPGLTPETFAAGLMSSQFPNPGAGAPPYWQPSVGFGPGDHSLLDDFQVAWWSDTAEAYDHQLGTSPQGSWCYLAQGARYRPGTYPAGAASHLFSPSVPCR